MQPAEIARRIRENHRDLVQAPAHKEGDTKELFPHLFVEPKGLIEILQFCRDNEALSFDFLECVTGLDTSQDFIVIYQLFSTTRGHRFNIKVSLERHRPRLQTATGVWAAALYHELEVADMF